MADDSSKQVLLKVNFSAHIYIYTGQDRYMGVLMEITL